MKTFSQFLTEDISQDTYMKGRCAIFALALHLEKGYPLGIMWDSNEDGRRDYMMLGDVDYDAYDEWETKHGEPFEPEDFAVPMHVYCYKTPTILVDVMGQTTESKMIQFFRKHSAAINDQFEPSFTESDRDEVEDLMKPASPGNPHGGMLAPKPGEIEKLKQYIRTNPDRY